MFQEAIEYFIRACPGPLLAERGLRLAAYQPVRGIGGLEGGDIAGANTTTIVCRDHVEAPKYVTSIVDVAERLNCKPAHLSQSALRRGYSYSRALRWIRFCHGIALRKTGISTDLAALRTGFSDPSGWTRFVRALVGRGPKQLPNVPLDFWVERAVEDVYLGTNLSVSVTPTRELRERD